MQGTAGRPLPGALVQACKLRGTAAGNSPAAAAASLTATARQAEHRVGSPVTRGITGLHASSSRSGRRAPAGRAAQAVPIAGRRSDGDLQTPKLSNEARSACGSPDLVAPAGPGANHAAAEQSAWLPLSSRRALRIL